MHETLTLFRQTWTDPEAENKVRVDLNSSIVQLGTLGSNCHSIQH